MICAASVTSSRRCNRLSVVQHHGGAVVLISVEWFQHSCNSGAPQHAGQCDGRQDIVGIPDPNCLWRFIVSRSK